MIKVYEGPDSFTGELIKDIIIDELRDNALCERLLEVIV